MSPRSDRSGFTLIELLVGLALTGALLLSATLVFDQLGDEGKRIATRKVDRDALRNGTATLRSLLRRADASSDSSERFIGDDQSAYFTTWCDMPRGWLERCRVRLHIAPLGEAFTVQVTIPDGNSIVVWTGNERPVFRYFNDASGAPWVSAWGTSIILPGALGIVTSADTLVFATGSRS